MHTVNHNMVAKEGNMPAHIFRWLHNQFGKTEPDHRAISYGSVYFNGGVLHWRIRFEIVNVLDRNTFNEYEFTAEFESESDATLYTLCWAHDSG